MVKRFAAAVLVCLLFLLPAAAFATEDESAFVDPTRNPNASEYSTDDPQNLEPDHIVAHSYILMERSKHHVLMEKNADVAMFPASTTKILTALMALEFGGDLSETLTVSAEAVTMPEDASRVPFRAGEVVTLKDALYGLMLKSGNDAANAIAEYIAGDIPTFVSRMNDTARILGCENTQFMNPHGYHDPAHFTTAYDLAIMLDAALDNETFREIIKTVNYSISPTATNPARPLINSNLHIDPTNERYYQYSIGGKTGFHSEAGYVLVEAAEKDGVELIAVVMYTGKYSRWPDTSRLFEYGFTQYKSVTPEMIYEEQPITLQINGFDPDSERINAQNFTGNTSETEHERLGRLLLGIRAVDPDRDVRITDLIPEVDAIIEDFSKSYADIQIHEMRAPITEGQVVGTLTFFPDGGEEAVYELTATRSIAARADAPPTLEEIEQRVLEDDAFFPPFGWDWVLPPILALLAVILLLRFIIRKGLRRRKGKKQIPKPKRRYFS